MPSIAHRALLRPGLRVLRRAPGELQIGLDPHHALSLPSTEPVRRTLAVVGVGGPACEADPAVLERLAEHALLTGEAPSTGRVELREFGSTPLPDVRDLVVGAGLDPVEPMQEGSPADVGLLLGVGEPDRTLLDPWLVEGLPHLVLRISEGIAYVGPFVVPGRTACLRCVDAHLTDADPRWPLLVHQQVALSAGPRPDGVPDPVPAALLALASGWAVADLLSQVGGGRPSTLSATLRLPPDLGATESVRWRRHPACGCSWDRVLAGSAAVGRVG